MRELSILTFITLDGVMQGPSSPDEDPSDGFTQGGWAADYWPEVMEQVMREAMAEPYSVLFGSPPWGGMFIPLTPLSVCLWQILTDGCFCQVPDIARIRSSIYGQWSHTRCPRCTRNIPRSHHIWSCICPGHQMCGSWRSWSTMGRK